MNVWMRLSDLLMAYDADFEVNTASECAWAGHLRLTLTNPENAPSRSMTFYSVGKGGPEEVATAVLDDAEGWIQETGIKPMPVPEWTED